MAFYQNQGSELISFGIGSLPGKPWTRYDSQPGQVIQGPVGYADKFIAAGYAMISEEEAEIARLYADEAEAKTKAEADAEAARVASLPQPAPRVQEQKAPERKGRRADRGPTGTG
jgi:hypothetical protein